MVFEKITQIKMSEIMVVARPAKSTIVLNILSSPGKAINLL